jgi:homoserine dehydrogenase
MPPVTTPTASLRPTPAGRPLRVALAGLGTVGGEVARALVSDPDHLARGAGGRRLELAVVAEPDPSRPRGLDLAGVERIADATELPGRDDIDIVVELIGGLEAAGRLVEGALRAGRAVVTANKALLARRGPELEAAARERGAALRFEAAVGGGIPVLAPLAGDLAANRIRRVRGIVNGSTNFVLTAMTTGGGEYDDVVAEARELGYLEADPSADVEGRDAADKVVLLARLAYGGWVDVSAVRRAPAALSGDGRPGITGVTASEIAGAARLGLVMKLIGFAERAMAAGSGAAGSSDAGSSDAGSGAGGILAGVVPAAVASSSTLGTTNGVTNIVEVVAEPVGRVSFVGPGAGGTATSSAVLGDILAIARGAGSTWGGLPPAGRAALAGDVLDGERRWFISVPGSLGRPLRERLVEAEVTETAVAGSFGLAVLTVMTSLAALRGALRTAGAPETTVIYPVVED